MSCNSDKRDTQTLTITKKYEPNERAEESNKTNEKFD